ncbi:MAG: hypothetical protein WAK17_00365, partial [Candidatus Nitrosopolaris sp.]
SWILRVRACAKSYNSTIRNSVICEVGYTDGQNQTPFDKTNTYNFGYHWGRLGAEGKASGDRAGDCEIDPYVPLKHTCMA